MEDETQQESMFDLSGKEFNKNFIDSSQPLFVPNNPIHWKAHKIQLLIARLEKQSESNPAQFNSKNYIDALESFEQCIKAIKEVEKNEGMDERELDQGGDEESAQKVGERVAPSVGSGVSADNPIAG